MLSPLDSLLRHPAPTRARILASLSDAERGHLAALASQRLPFRAFLESPDFCGLALSPMVAAIADAADGARPTTIDDARARRYFGCPLAQLPRRARRTIAVQAGGRGGKTSRLLAPKALHAAWTVPLPTLAEGEHAVALIVSSELAFAQQALTFCKGYVEASPVLRAALVGEPKTESLTLRRPDGRLVDVRVRAAGARGKGGRAFTLCFAGFDEAAFFYDESGAVNDREIYRACSPRIVPGGQLWMVSTPWVEGVGLLEDELAANWGHHAETLAVRGVGTRALNPSWDPTGEIEAKERRTDPDNARRELDAEPLTAGSTHFLSREAIDAAFRDHLPQTTEYEAGYAHAAGGDTGFRKNSSALAVARRAAGDPLAPVRLCRLEERKPAPGLPLQPEAVAGEFAAIFTAYGARDLVTDSHELERVAAALAAYGVSATTAPAPEAAFVALRSVLHAGRLELPPHPRLRAQLRDVMARPMPGGGVQIVLKKTADGAHGDLVVALARAVWRLDAAPTDGHSFDGHLPV